MRRVPMADEPDEEATPSLRETRERVRRGVVLRQLTEDERKARDQARAEARRNRSAADVAWNTRRWHG
jgi:hypothetical protein